MAEKRSFESRLQRLEEIVSALENSVDIVVFGILSRQQNDRDRVLFPDAATAGKSVGARHHNIQNNKIGAFFIKHTQKCVACFKRAHLISVIFKKALKRFPDVFFVLRDIDQLFHSASQKQ